MVQISGFWSTSIFSRRETVFQVDARKQLLPAWKGNLALEQQVIESADDLWKLFLSPRLGWGPVLTIPSYFILSGSAVIC